MRQACVRKQKIELTDYNYLRDINNRLLMSRLSTFEVDVLREVLNTSLKFKSSELGEILETDSASVMAVLIKLSQTGLLRINENMITVDKEMRKYYETQIVKFDDDFEPGMEFLQGLLGKIPIHQLPVWYGISRISDHIFQSIVEKYFQTARIYERYLEEVEFDDPLLYKIMKDVFASPELKLPSRELIKKHGLTHESFEQKMLILEYSFVCCIAYERLENLWEEVVTPFHEWREYLRHLRDTHPKRIEEGIDRYHISDFGFVEDLEKLLNALPIKIAGADLDEEGMLCKLNKKLIKSIAPQVIETPLQDSYISRLLSKAHRLNLMEISSTHANLSKTGKEWLKLNVQDRAHTVSGLPLECHEFFGDKDVREIEKGLRRLSKAGWIEFDAFLNNLTAQVGKVEQVSLKNKGKRWWYALPSYSVQEKEFIRTIICEKFADAGIVSLGSFEQRLCFCVTPFGRVHLNG